MPQVAGLRSCGTEIQKPSREASDTGVTSDRLVYLIGVFTVALLALHL